MGKSVCYDFGKRKLVDSIKNKSAQGLLWPGSLWLKLKSTWGFGVESTGLELCTFWELTHAGETPVGVFLREWTDQT